MRLAVLSLMLLCLAVPAAADAAPGAIDRSFGQDGVKTVHIPQLSVSLDLVGVQPNGRIVVGTPTSTGEDVPDADRGYVLRAFRPNGVSDASFGRRGMIDSGLSSGRGVMLPDGRVVVGLVAAAPDGQMSLRLVRLKRDGSRDTRYGDLEGIQLPFTQTGRPTFAVAPGGAIVVVIDQGTDTVVTRLKADGRPDPTFGTNGQTTLALGGIGETKVSVQPGGDIVLGVNAVVAGKPALRLTRLTRDGTLDPSFGTDGSATWDAELDYTWELGTDRSGALVVAGDTWRNGGPLTPFVLRGPANAATQGTRSDGPATGAYVPADLAIDGRGAALVAGLVDDRFAVTRHGKDGLDRRFGLEGVASHPFGLTASLGTVALQPDGRIVVAGGERGANGDDLIRIVRFWGGYDWDRPSIAARVTCTKGTARLKVAVADRSTLSDLSVSTGPRRLAHTERKRLRLHVPRSRSLTVRAVDGSGNERTRRLRTPRCR